MKISATAVLLLIIINGPLSAPISAQSKPEFKLSVVPNEETSWGRAANRFRDGIKYRTNGRVQIKNYFDGRLFPGNQTTEFELLQQGVADFAIGSTINWSPQVKELNLFALPFIFQSYKDIDAVELGEPGKQLFKQIEDKAVIPIAWGENGFREVTNSKHPIHRPADLLGLNVRVVGAPIFTDTFLALGAKPVALSWDKAQVAIKEGTVDSQENPVALFIPYRIWAVHPHVTLWHYAVDPLILAVSGKTWLSLSPEDQKIVQEVGVEVMAQQKKEAREGLDDSTQVIDNLRNIYGMKVVSLSPTEVTEFRNQTRDVYIRWSEQIGIELVHSAEKIVGSKN